MKYFTIIAPKTIKLNSNYHVAVSAYDFDVPQSLAIAINSEDDSHDENHERTRPTREIQRQIFTLSGNKTKILSYDIKSLPPANYFLSAKSIDGENFEKRINLNLNAKKFSVFIQTDKSIYKPSEKIQFRVLLLDIDTKPFESSNVLIFVTDGDMNRMKQFSNPKFTKGVFQGELQLSDLPVMGAWTIHVRVDDAEEEMKNFEVAEYVLPKFEVTVEANPHVAFKDGKIRATVCGKYTFGKLAKGVAKVTAEVYSSGWGYCCGPVSTVKVVKTVDIDGRKEVEFDVKDELDIKEIKNSLIVKIEASFTEELSGREHKGSTEVIVHKNAHTIELINSGEKFKPGLPFSVTAVVKDVRNNVPVMCDNENPVKFTITYYKELKPDEETPIKQVKITPYRGYRRFHENAEEKTEEVFLKDGAAVLNLDVPGDVDEVRVQAKYLEVVENNRRISKPDCESNQFIQIKLMTQNPTIDKEVSIDVLATEEMKSLTYMLMSRGNLISSETLIIQNSKKFNFKITPSVEMSPETKLILYYVRPDGEIISDQINIDFGFVFQNFVQLKLSQHQSKPGEMINLTVNANVNSFVGLLGVDQSVLLLKSGNDIEKTSIIDSVKNFEYPTHCNSTYHIYEDAMRYADFNELKCVVITNAKPEYEKPRYFHPMMMACRAVPMMMADSAMDHDSSVASRSKMAESAPLVGGAQVPKFEVRKKFPETWIFDSFDMSEGKTILTKKVPDTITSWILTGFAIDPIKGLGLTDAPTKLNVFQPFFVSTNLPYSIKRGETVAVPIIIFNYLEQDQEVNVTLFNNDGEFEFTNEASAEKQPTKNVLVKSNIGSTVSFMIKPLKAGNIKIKVVATSAVAGDGVEQFLRVEPEGVTQYKNEALFIDLRNEKSFKSAFNIEVPDFAVPYSTKIEVSAMGDILGPTIENLDKLIRIPFGCGEQNMLNFVPNIIVLEYLSVLKKLTPEIALKAKKFMENGYQRELTYKHNDGSYSAFGGSDNSGSTWLTAFVAKSFHQASKYIEVDSETVNQALDFLSEVQNEDGSFKEVGTVFHTDMQGGSSKGLGLTAYVLITFLENRKEANNYEETIQKALSFITANINSIDDSYSLAIVSYALQISKHEMKDSLLEKLDRKAEKKDSMKFWMKTSVKPKPCWNFQPNAINIEMTAYALQAQLEADKVLDSVPIMRWLVAQRNENGGFQSTQDTIVGLQALSKLATKIFVPDSEIKISVKQEQGSEVKLELNADNSLVLQKFELNSSSRNFEVTANGHGFSILQLSYKFNVSDNFDGPRFNLEPKLVEGDNKNVLLLKVTTSYIADLSSQKSNMAVMEVSFPSGFIFDSDFLEELKAMEKIKKVETKDGETIVVVYFYDIDTTRLSLDFKAIRTHNVAELKPASVLIYDYYENSRKATSMYNPPAVTLNEIILIEAQ